MKLVAAAVGLAIAVGVVLYLYETTSAPVPSSAVQVAPAADDARVAQLTQQVEALQRSLTAMQSQLASQQHAGSPERAKGTSEATSPALDVEAQRAMEAERRRQYMTGIAAGFNNERVDPVWSAHTASRVMAAFDGQDELRKHLRNVECRTQTCRVQMEEDDSVEVSRQMPFLSLALADVLPSMNVDYVDQGNGHRMMVMYMSNQGTAASAVQK